MWPAGSDRCCRGSWSSAQPGTPCAGTCGPAPVVVARDSGTRSCSTPMIPSPPGWRRWWDEEGDEGCPKTRWKKWWRWGEGKGWRWIQNKRQKRMRNGWCFSYGSSCAPWRGPGDCFCWKMAATSFQRFPSNTFSEIITSIWKTRTDKGDRDVGLLQPPTCPHDLHSAAPTGKGQTNGISMCQYVCVLWSGLYLQCKHVCGFKWVVIMCS